MLKTPGRYLRQLREAAGLSLDDVALRTETIPPVSAHRRAEWLAEIEADISPPPLGLAEALEDCFKVDPVVLDTLVADREGMTLWVPARRTASAGTAPPPLYRYPVLSAEEAQRQVEQRGAAA